MQQQLVVLQEENLQLKASNRVGELAAASIRPGAPTCGCCAPHWQTLLICLCTSRTTSPGPWPVSQNAWEASRVSAAVQASVFGLHQNDRDAEGYVYCGPGSCIGVGRGGEFASSPELPLPGRILQGVRNGVRPSSCTGRHHPVLVHKETTGGAGPTQGEKIVGVTDSPKGSSVPATAGNFLALAKGGRQGWSPVSVSSSPARSLVSAYVCLARSPVSVSSGPTWSTVSA